MKSINLIFGCHSHQPVGNFDFVFQEAYEKAYVPFIDVLEKFPEVCVTLHYTGPLLDWFAQHAPDYLNRVAALVRKGQVEIMGGGYYEPLLCAIPEEDAIAQIRRMQQFCQTAFGQTPKGMWLTERVWEPRMAHTLAKAGVEYAALDDAHFMCSGVPRDDLFGFFMTEDEGQSVKVFPILERLRYLVPFHQVYETIDYLRDHATEDGLRCAVLHDDGEKFGIWPGTYHSVYEEGWLEEFFTALTENKDWLHCTTYAQYLQNAKPVGRTYITCAAYKEMMEWALPTDMQRQLKSVQAEINQDPERNARYGQFLRGGFWRNFLAKYEEANNIQKRMLRVSRRHKRLCEAHAAHPDLDKAERLLHQGQCNCAYWHGVFGGLYLNHLRTAIYEKLIEADHVLDGIEHPEAGWVTCESVDFDADGNPEVVLENSQLALFFKPDDGGTLFEIDYKPKPFNFGNTLSRRDEPYHDAIRSGNIQVGDSDAGDVSIHDLVKAKETGLENLLIYDPYRRVSLRDHLFVPPVTVEDLWSGRQAETGSFSVASYDFTTEKDAVTLTHQAANSDSSPDAVCISKTIGLKADASAFEIRYDIGYDGKETQQVMFGTEFGINLLTGDAEDRYYRSDDVDLQKMRLGVQGVTGELSHIALCDEWQQLEFSLHFSRDTRVYHYPIETVSQSEGGQERVYQGSIVVPIWKLELKPESQISIVISVDIKQRDFS